MSEGSSKTFPIAFLFLLFVGILLLVIFRLREPQPVQGVQSASEPQPRLRPVGEEVVEQQSIAEPPRKSLAPQVQIVVQDKLSLTPLPLVGAFYFDHRAENSWWRGPGDSLPFGTESLDAILLVADGYVPTLISGPVLKSLTVQLEPVARVQVEIQKKDGTPVSGISLSLRGEGRLMEESILFERLKGLRELVMVPGVSAMSEERMHTVLAKWEEGRVLRSIRRQLRRMKGRWLPEEVNLTVPLYPDPKTKETDAQGIAAWDFVYTTMDLYWRHDTSLPILCEPPFDLKKEFAAEGGGFRASFTGPKTRRSGYFRVAPGENRILRSLIGDNHRVWGHLGPEFDPDKPVRIALIGVDVVEGEDGNAFRNFGTEGLLSSAPDGKFVFEGVMPGVKGVTVLQEISENHWAFARDNFTLAEGEDHNTGVLSPLPERLEISLGFELEDGAPIDFASFSQSVGWEEPVRSDLVLRQGEKELDHPIWMMIPGVPHETSLLFDGFPIGLWGAQALPLKWPQSLGDFQLPGNDACADFSSAQPVRLNYVLAKKD
ncbi:MAG: hypothetical protein DWQ01_15285 [Planctomycetota bacterium]|nr:MAG: hypothetical protein DWQ01_15285 [Planctomycetota bacterium]